MTLSLLLNGKKYFTVTYHRITVNTMKLLGHHHLNELLVVNLAIAINISLSDHLIDLLVRKLLTEVSHDVSELGSRDESVAILVEHLKGLKDLLLAVSPM